MSMEALYRRAAEATAVGSRSFYFATRFFPQTLARSAHAVYWFCRHTDDLVDEAGSIEQGREQLEDWSRQVEAAFQGEEPSHPVLRLFLEAVTRHGIPLEYPRDLIEGMRMDLSGTQFQDFDGLWKFCYRVASVVGLMMSHVIGFRPPALEYAIDLGVAMQLTNILRDVGEDLGRGRIYLPLVEMQCFGYSEEELRAHVRNEAFLELMRFQIARARVYYERAMPGIGLLDADGRFAVQIAAEVYRQILHQIEAANYDVFSRRAVVPARTKYWLTAKSMALPVARQGLRRLGLRRG